jgi:hypothetical protein
MTYQAGSSIQAVPAFIAMRNLGKIETRDLLYKTSCRECRVSNTSRDYGFEIV